MKAEAMAATLRDAVAAAFAGVTVTAEKTIAGKCCWLDIEKGKKHVVVEIREAGYGVSDLDNVVGFEGPEEVYEHPEDVLKRIGEILTKAA